MQIVRQLCCIHEFKPNFLCSHYVMPQVFLQQCIHLLCLLICLRVIGNGGFRFYSHNLEQIYPKCIYESQVPITYNVLECFKVLHNMLKKSLVASSIRHSCGAGINVAYFENLVKTLSLIYMLKILFQFIFGYRSLFKQ